jgi:hypothetical protein
MASLQLDSSVPFSDTPIDAMFQDLPDDDVTELISPIPTHQWITDFVNEWTEGDFTLPLELDKSSN